jgi:hypothetical protein
MTATAIGWAASAHADTLYQFVSPSGTVACTMSQDSDGNGHVACDVGDYTFDPPMWCSSANDLVSFELVQGLSAQLYCHNDATIDPDLPVVYDQKRSVGLIDCENVSGAQPHTECADRASGHFFNVFADHYEIG